MRGLLRSTLPVFLYSATFPDSALSLSRPIVADSDSSVSLSTVAIDARPPSSVHTLDASLMEYACERDHRQHCLAAPNLLYCVSLDNAVYIYTPFANTDAGRISMWLSPALPFQPEFRFINRIYSQLCRKIQRHKNKKRSHHFTYPTVFFAVISYVPSC